MTIRQVLRAGATAGGLCLLTFAATACGEAAVAPAPLRTVRFVEVSPTNGLRSETLSGSVEAADRTRLSFQVTGRLTTLSVAPGDEVEKGQAVAAIDPADYQLKLQEARASAAQSVAQARSAAANYERVRALYSNQNASQQDLDTARAQKDSAQSAASAVGQSVRQLERQLEYCTLTAPESGTIAEVAVEANEVVSTGQVVAVLQSGDALQVAVDVPESAVTRIKRGDPATVVLDSSPDAPLTGAVAEVGTPAAGGAAFPVKVSLPEGAEGVRSGMAAAVTFSTGNDDATDEPEKFVVPSTAVSEDREGRFVFIAEGAGTTDDDSGTWVVRRRGVTLGAIESGGIEITEGVTAGDRVIIAGVSRIRDGLDVKASLPEPPAGTGDQSAGDAP